MAQKYRPFSSTTSTAARPTAPVRIGLDGTDYEIDLNAEHTRQLRDALARYISAARRAGGSIRSRPAAPARPRRPDPTLLKSASWAKAQGIEVKDRGRIPAELVSSSRRQPDREI